MALTWDFFSALITTNLARFSLCSGFNVVGHGLFASFFLSQEYFDDKRSPEYLLNWSCNYHICSNRQYCQLPEVASVFWFSSFNDFFFCRESLFDHAMQKRPYCSPFNLMNWEFLMEKDLGVQSLVVVVLFCQWVLWCQFNQVSSACRLFFWSSVIFIQPFVPSQNPRSSQFFLF